MIKRLAVVALLACVSLAGCGQGEPAGRSPDAGSTHTEPSGEPSSVPRPAADRPKQAKRALRVAAASVLLDQPIAFTFEVESDDVAMLTAEGVQVLEGGWTAVVVTTDPATPDESYTMDARSDGTTGWMRMREWPERMQGCWYAMGPGVVPIGIAALVPDEVSYVSVLAALGTTGFEPGSNTELRGSVRLRNVLALLTRSVLEQIDTTSRNILGARVPATIMLDGRRVSAVEIDGQSIVDTLAERAIEVGDVASGALGMLSFNVTYPEQTNVELADPPSEATVVPEGARTCH